MFHSPLLFIIDASAHEFAIVLPERKTTNKSQLGVCAMCYSTRVPEPQEAVSAILTLSFRQVPSGNLPAALSGQKVANLGAI